MSSAGKKRTKRDAPTDGAADENPNKVAPKSRRVPIEASPHAGPTDFTAGEYKPAASLPAFTNSLPARDANDTLKVVCWNINGLRAAFAPGEKRANALDWLCREDADVVALQVRS